MVSPVTPASSSTSIYGFNFLYKYQVDPDIREKDYFGMLPDEIILMIFRHCSKSTLIDCACVSRRWKNIAFDSDLWLHIDISQQKISSDTMKHVLSRKPIVLRMSQTEINTPIFKEVNDFSSNLSSKLEYLDLSMASILSCDLKVLLATCRSLIKLSLENCVVNEGVCEEIGTNSKLTVLNMSQCSGLNDMGLKSFLRKCNNLIELNIAWTRLDTAAIECVCRFLPREILKLNFSGCIEEISDSHVNILVSRCNKLIELDLSDSIRITQSSVAAICENLKNLQVLSLSRCYKIYSTNYSALGTNFNQTTLIFQKLFALPVLSHLNIFGLFPEAHIDLLRKSYSIAINEMIFSFIARPTVGERRSSVWCIRIRD